MLCHITYKLDDIIYVYDNISCICIYIYIHTHTYIYICNTKYDDIRTPGGGAATPWGNAPSGNNKNNIK